ncbi:hypothetical protein GCM10027051_05130 [Niabella terrae]
MNSAVAEKNTDRPGIVQPRQHQPTAADVNFVYDYESLLSPEQQKKLDTIARTFEKSNLIAIKINTISGFAAPSGTFQYNRQDLADWDQAHGGSQKVMVISFSKSLAQAHIDFGAYVGKFLTQEKAAAILDSQYQPLAAKGQYFEGIYNTLNAVTDQIRSNVQFNPRPVSK